MTPWRNAPPQNLSHPGTSHILSQYHLLCVQRGILQTYTAAMGSPVSPVGANLYMERFKTRALATAPHPLSAWYRCVDDIFGVIHIYHIEEFTAHISSLDTNIKFTTNQNWMVNFHSSTYVSMSMMMVAPKSLFIGNPHIQTNI